MTIPQTLIGVATLPSLVGGIIKCFDFFDSMLNPAGRKATADWLKNLPQESDACNWSGAFSGVVDLTFGKRPFSLCFFLRSCVASLIAFGLTLIFKVGFHPGWDHLWAMLGVGLLVNAIPDYSSLLISRSILREMTKDPRPGRVLGLIFLDILLKIFSATLIIYAGGVIIHYLLSWGHSVRWTEPWSQSLGVLGEFYDGFPFPTRAGSPPLYEICFYSSFFTSLWLCLYIVGGAITKAIYGSAKLWRIVVPFIDLDQTPLKSIGRIVAAVIGAGYVAIGTAYSLYKFV
jgi:hypothetical protein